MFVTKLNTPKSDYRERTGTKWLVLGLGNPNLALKLTTRFQSFLDNLVLKYPV